MQSECADQRHRDDDNAGGDGAVSGRLPRAHGTIRQDANQHDGEGQRPLAPDRREPRTGERHVAAEPRGNGVSRLVHPHREESHRRRGNPHEHPRQCERERQGDDSDEVLMRISLGRPPRRHRRRVVCRGRHLVCLVGRHPVDLGEDHAAPQALRDVGAVGEAALRTVHLRTVIGPRPAVRYQDNSRKLAAPAGTHGSARHFTPHSSRA